MSQQKLKKLAGILILTATIGAFTYYAYTHPKEVFDPILQLSVIAIFLVITGYMGVTLTNSVILRDSLTMLKTSYSRSESFLLTAYSSIVNFFGPLQSGPGFRAIFLKQKLGVKLRDYTLTMILYYSFFALVNALVIAIFFSSKAGMQYGILAFVAVIMGLIGGLFAIKKYVSKKQSERLQTFLVSKQAASIFLFTLVQCALMTSIYFVELYSVNSNVSLAQAAAYTAVANFSLFVSLTPGAIGIRESFLLFSQQLHGIDQQTVIAASIIDRALYFVVLGLLFILTLSLHAKNKLAIRKQDTI